MREGFNFAAFVLTALWAFANRMWIRGTVLVGIFLGLMVLGYVGLNPVGQGILILTVMAWAGM